MKLRTDWLIEEGEVVLRQRYHLEAFVRGYPFTWDDVKFCLRVVYSMFYQLVRVCC